MIMVSAGSKIKNEDNKTVVLVSPPSRMMNHYRPPLALMYISGYLKQQGIKTQIVDTIMGKILTRVYKSKTLTPLVVKH